MFVVHQEVRFHKFILRQIMHRPDYRALCLLNANDSLITGTYHHSIMEYLNLYQASPDDPYLNFMLGISFAHLASKKDITRRHDTCIQAFAFLSRYEELRGRCAEVYYNLGRAMQQLGIVFVAMHYYEKVLALDPIAGFDLRPEAAYNLSQIYRASGNEKVAREYLRKFCSY